MEVTMVYKNLNGVALSALGMGCMRLPQKSENGADIDEVALAEMVELAMSRGVNYFDTAWVYHQGKSEEFMGRALAKYPRESFYIATKFPGFSPEFWGNAPKIFAAQLERLGMDYIDYYLLHSVGSSMDDFQKRYIDNGILDFLLKEREKGKIRHLGWSFHVDQSVFDHILSLHDEVKWDFVLIQMNYSDWRNARGSNVNAEYLYGELEKRGIPNLIMEPLLGGRLSNVPDHIATRLKQQEPTKSVASWAFRFNGSHPNVLSVLSGMTYMEHLQDNIRSFSPLVPLTDDEKDFLFETAELMLRYPTIPCNDCKYCMPCPYGLDIPAILLHYNKCVNEGNLSKSSKDSNYRKARRAFLVGYDRAVEKLRQADHCVGCEQCNKHCPQRIDIPKEIRRIDQYIETLKQGKEF